MSNNPWAECDALKAENERLKQENEALKAALVKDETQPDEAAAWRDEGDVEC